MQYGFKFCSFIFVLLFSHTLFANTLATIEALQAPVIIERDNSRFAAFSSTELHHNDRILTGKNSRLLLRLGDDSTVKLGENVDFKLTKKSASEQDNDTYRATLDVIKGAFRFTTGVLAKFRKRDVTARISTITIGIRGTDVWGKSEADRDFVVLLEGNIDIQRENEAATRMTDAMSLFMAPKDQPANDIVPVNPDDLSLWAQETELQEGQGIINADGRFILNLASFQNHAIAEERKQQLSQSGYPVEISRVQVGSEDWSRLIISGIQSFTDAQNLKETIGAEYSFTSMWISE